MRVLIGCEYSATVRDAFRRLGHDAWSCDLLPCDGDPAWHIQGDLLELLQPGRWDLAVFHPPCTDIAVSGAAHFAAKRADGRQQRALDFVRALMNAPIERIALENPVSIISSQIRKPEQIVQPWMFGHTESKATCLWLKNLPLLTPTDVRSIPECGHWDNTTPSGQNKLGPSPDRWKLRSTTYVGLANAMAKQWSTPQPYQPRLEF